MDVGSVSGVAGAPFASGAATHVPAASAQPWGAHGGPSPQPGTIDFTVRISPAAMKAIEHDLATTLHNSSPVSRLAEDLAALALLALLEQQNQNQNSSSLNVVAAIGAYLAIQALSS